jgi:hypothetical protein
MDDIAAAAVTQPAVASPPNPPPSSAGPTGPLGVTRTSSASGAIGGPHQAGLPRIKSGVIKTGDSMVYIEAEQRAPLSPQGSWGAVPPHSQGWGTVHNAPHHNPHQHPHRVVVGSPVRGGGLRDSSSGEGCAGVLWGPDVRVGDPVGIITIEDVIEEVRHWVCAVRVAWCAVLCHVVPC